MVHYKLTYFDARGIAEPARQLFHLAGVEYEDDRFGKEEWPERQPKTPFGKVPVLTVDGLEIGQSSAIIRYLARKYGYAGKTAEEEALVDAITDQYKDFFAVFIQWTRKFFFGAPQAELDKIRAEIVNPARDEYLRILNKTLENNKSGYLVGDGLTWADLVVADNLVSLAKHGYYQPDKEPRLAKFHAKINETPKLKEYLAARKDYIL